jgi:hypothetical protein
VEADEIKTGYVSLKLFLASVGNEVYPGSQVDTANLEDGLVYVKDLGTEINYSKGIFGQNRNKLWNSDNKSESCGI